MTRDLEPQTVEGAGFSLPVLVDLHEEFQVRAFGQLFANGDTDLLEHRAFVADHDALL